MKTASLPSATGAASAMLSPAIESASMVADPVASAMRAPFGLLNSTLKFSLGSAVESLRIGTRMDSVVWFGPKRSVPEVVV